MRIIPNFSFDQLSFWLGFLAASLFWWFFSKSRVFFPEIKSFLTAQRESFQKRRTFGAEMVLRRETIKRAQGLHLARELFALDEILIEPHVIAPPAPITPENSLSTGSLIQQTIPYYPDLPELSGAFHRARLTLAETLQGGANILLIGQPGTGKTVALAALASQSARKSLPTDKLNEKLPLFLHVFDLDLSLPFYAPEKVLIQAICEQSPGLSSKRLAGLVLRSLSQGNCLLILDGLDELPPERFEKTVNFLKSLTLKYPGTQYITAASPDHLTGLPDLRTFPLALASWSSAEKASFVEQWGRLWKEKIAPAKAESVSGTANPLILTNWFMRDISQRSPLDWTLRIWAAYSGDSAGPSFSQAMAAYLERITKNTVPPEALAAGAAELIHSTQPGISYRKLSRTFSKLRPQDFPEEEGSPLTDSEVPTQNRLRGIKSIKRKRPRKISSVDRALNTLLDAGFLFEHRNEQLRFSTPLLSGYFAALLLEDVDFESMEKGKWAVEQSALQFLAARGKATLWAHDLPGVIQPPLFDPLWRVCRAMQYAPHANWRDEIMRFLLDQLHDHSLSLNERLRLLTGFALTNDPSLPVLFRKLIQSETPEIRFLAALGCGLIEEPESLVQLQQILHDPVLEVQIAACLALSAIPSPQAFESLADALFQGEESVQQTAAELLAFKGEEGHQVLKEALEVDNLLVRRAAVLGLTHVHALWADELLQKVSIEDTQWVVRNAAGQARDIRLLPDRQIPTPLPPPADSSWLITFASRMGSGVTPDEDAVEILLSALKNGSMPESIAALDYLRLTPEKEIITAIAGAARSAQGDLQLAAHRALWQLKASQAASTPYPIE